MHRADRQPAVLVGTLRAARSGGGSCTTLGATVTVHSFPAVATPDACVLVLGTMPGKVSLLAQQYYAHPKNLFWRLSGEVLCFDAVAPYQIRVGTLMNCGVSL